MLRDPVCCANESCNYMLCREHLTNDQNMRCPNRCGTDPIQTVKVQRVILNQLMSLTIRCEICFKNYELGERETHFSKYCEQLVIEDCAFADCKHFSAPLRREEFETHIAEVCATKAK